MSEPLLRVRLVDTDDLPVGRVLTRREALVLLGSTGTLFLLGSSPSKPAHSRIPGPRVPCVVRPASTEGPFYVDEKLNRSDIRSDPTDGSIKEGTLLILTVNVSSIAKGSCNPLEGAIVDLWQCDADGVYSDVEDSEFSYDTRGKKFLRGHQLTDPKGVARFTTIYPGWYPTRTPHIHYKIRSPESARSAYEFAGQMYFDEGVSDRVYRRPPYAARGKRSVSNRTDRIYNSDGGPRSILMVNPSREGYTGTFDVSLHLG